LDPEISTSPTLWSRVIEPNAFSRRCRPRPLLKASWPLALTTTAAAFSPETTTSPNLERADSAIVSGIVTSMSTAKETWPRPVKVAPWSGYFVRMAIVDPRSSTVTLIPSPNFCAHSPSDEETVIFARTRTSESACVPIRSAPWLCSISSCCPALTGRVFEKSRSKLPPGSRVSSRAASGAARASSSAAAAAAERNPARRVMT